MKARKVMENASVRLVGLVQHARSVTLHLLEIIATSASEGGKESSVTVAVLHILVKTVTNARKDGLQRTTFMVEFCVDVANLIDTVRIAKRAQIAKNTMHRLYVRTTITTSRTRMTHPNVH